ncbi:MAG: IS66 family insertion sequence element accessory protein TnpB [Deltaproteobacteria bacterium]|nr:IS66 family insertion sequence element accessory protein TnpB [Deltaproteobacteria bacterium]
MDTQKVTAQYRLSQWAKVIQARQDSGQNIKDFCRATGISKNQYFYWQKKLRNAVSTELTIEEKSMDPTPNGWIQLASVQAQKMKATLDIEISGFHISVNAGTDPELLKKVCRVLGSL